MRRTDKEIKDRHLVEEILEKAESIRLAMCDEGEPYIVAMNYAYTDGVIYLHSAKQGRKAAILRKNGRVAFQTDIGAELVIREEACNCTTRFKSVFGTGNAALIEEGEERERALDAIMRKHTGQSGFSYAPKVLERTMVIRIDIESLTGKMSGY